MGIQKGKRGGEREERKRRERERGKRIIRKRR